MEHSKKTKKENLCGIVMPISAIDGCNETHWTDVYDIIYEAIFDAGFEANMVSYADDVGVIQKRIIQNLYENPIVVCDVSGKNPNVMFELGMRLAFDKPTIIIKDDKTSYSFDTSPIEHLEYPRDLRFNKIQEFKKRLTEKIIKTHENSIEDENFSTFLKHFGEFKVAKIETKEVPQQEIILDEIKNLRKLFTQSKNQNFVNTKFTKEFSYENSRNEFEDDNKINVCCGNGVSKDIIQGVMPQILSIPGIVSAELKELSDNHCHLNVSIEPSSDKLLIRNEIRSLTKGKNQIIKRKKNDT